MLEKEYAKRATPRMKFVPIRSALNNAIISLKKTRDRYLYEELNNQPQVQPIVRTPEEVTEMLNKISCPDCNKNSSHCHFSESDCKNYWYEWLTKKEV